MEIKQWFLEKNFTESERYAISVGTISQISETEKAVKVEISSNFGKMIRWIPKSVIIMGSQKKEVKVEPKETIWETFKTIVTTKSGENIEIVEKDNKGHLKGANGKLYLASFYGIK